MIKKILAIFLFFLLILISITQPLNSELLLNNQKNLNNSNEDYKKLTNTDIFASTINNTSTVIKNFDENNVLYGYITDQSTGEAIEGAEIEIYQYDNQGNWDYNQTYSNSSGYYKIYFASGEIYAKVSAEGYYREVIIDFLQIGPNVTLSINVSLYSKFSESSVIMGYVTDELTGEPINGAEVDVYWADDKDHNSYNNTYSDSSGFYSINVAAGIIDPDYSCEGYFSSCSWDQYNIGEQEVMWFNVSLYPKPPESSVIMGYVTDELTGEPINGAEVEVNWEGDGDHYDYNYTFSDSFGFYCMNVPAGVIDLNYRHENYFISYYYDQYDIGEQEVMWLNASLYPKPPESSVIMGYVTDAITGNSIENFVDIDFTWYDDLGHHDRNWTEPNSSGFYRMNVKPGNFYISTYCKGYEDIYTDFYQIQDNESLWFNLSLWPEPFESSTIYGYITDSKTSNPIDDAFITLNWTNSEGNFGTYETYTDPSGFYSIKVPSATIDLFVYAEGYYYKKFKGISIEDFQSKCHNFSLEPEVIQINIEKPQRAFYVNNNKIINFPFSKSLIIGGIDIKVNSSDNITCVEFYINDELMSIDQNPPFIWNWDKKENFKVRNNLRVVAYGQEGGKTEKEITVWRLL